MFSLCLSMFDEVWSVCYACKMTITQTTDIPTYITHVFCIHTALRLHNEGENDQNLKHGQVQYLIT